MKTSKFSKAAIAMLLLFVLCGYSAQAQNETAQKQDSTVHKCAYGFEALGSISRDGFGFNLSPCFSVRHKLSSFSVGPNIQMTRGNISGIKFSYEYTADTILRCRNMQAFIQSNFTYHTGAYLTDKNIADERAFSEQHTGVNVAGIENWRLKTLEYFAGAGIRKEFGGFGISASVGIGGFYTYHDPKLWKGPLHREMTIAIVQFQTGMTYMF